MGVLKVKVAGNWEPVPIISGGGPLPAGGLAGQVLTKQSNADNDARWAGQSIRQYTADATWHEIGVAGEPAFSNGWVNYPGFNTAGFRMDSEGWVYMKGLVRLGTINTSVFTLPLAYRPWKTVFFPTLCNGLIAYIQINTDGTVGAYVMGGSNAWISLETVRFPAWNRWSQFVGKYIPLEGQELRAYPSEYLTGLWPQTNGMIRIMGISGALPAAGTVMSYLNDINKGAWTYIFGVATNDTNGGRAVEISRRFGFYSNGPAGTAWTMYSTEYGTLAVEDQWIAPTLENGWTNWPTSATNWHTPAGYWKDAAGVVHLRGMLQSGASATARIFTLPVGYRPAGQVLCLGASVAAAATRIDIQTDGAVMPSGNAAGWTSIDGINFYAAGA